MIEPAETDSRVAQLTLNKDELHVIERAFLAALLVSVEEMMGIAEPAPPTIEAVLAADRAIRAIGPMSCGRLIARLATLRAGLEGRPVSPVYGQTR